MSAAETLPLMTLIMMTLIILIHTDQPRWLPSVRISLISVISVEVFQTSGKRLGDGKHLVGFGAHANVFCEVGPSHRAGAIHQELSRTRNVMLCGAAGDVQQVVAANHLGIGVGKQREGVAGFIAEFLGLLGSINTDSHRANTGIGKLRQIFLYAS
jgi:hypothetical protein